MIQRVQSLFLLAVVAIALLLLIWNPKYGQFNDNAANVQVKLKYNSTINIVKGSTSIGIPPSTNKYINTLLIGIIGLSALFCIFLFKNRKAQKLVCLYLILAIFILMFILGYDYYNTSTHMKNSDSYPDFNIIWPIAMIVFILLARSRIKRDEQIIKSMDSIR